MKKIIALAAIALFAAACNDGKLYMDPNWYLAGGGEQQLFKEFTYTNSGLPNDPSATTVTTITINGEKIISKTIASTDGTVLCTSSAILDGMDYQAFTSFVAEAKLVDYVTPDPATTPEDVVCTALGTEDIAITYQRLDGKNVQIDNPDDHCPVSEAIMALAQNAIDLANEQFPECTAASASAAAEEPAAEDLFDSLSINYGAAIAPDATGTTIELTAARELTFASYVSDSGGETTENCRVTGEVTAEELQTIADLVATADLIDVEISETCEPLVGTTGVTINYEQTDGRRNAFHTACALTAEIDELMETLAAIAQTIAATCPAATK